MTVHVPTAPEGKQVCWEFATDGYDIGFGIYFDWTPVTSRAITVHVSESSDDEDEDEDPEGELVPLPDLFYIRKYINIIMFWHGLFYMTYIDFCIHTSMY